MLYAISSRSKSGMSRQGLGKTSRDLMRHSKSVLNRQVQCNVHYNYYQ